MHILPNHRSTDRQNPGPGTRNPEPTGEPHQNQIPNSGRRSNRMGLNYVVPVGPTGTYTIVRSHIYRYDRTAVCIQARVDTRVYNICNVYIIIHPWVDTTIV